jgi:hypothetical protein
MDRGRELGGENKICYYIKRQPNIKYAYAKNENVFIRFSFRI